MADHVEFQNTPGTVTWRLHFSSPPDVVFEFLDSPEKRSRYWAESAEENQGVITYLFLNGIECRGRILDRKPGRYFRVEYFDWDVSFELVASDDGGCDMTMTCRQIDESDMTEAIAGWVSWLMAMKAAVDFDVDLRNHDSRRTWYDGFADN